MDTNFLISMLCLLSSVAGALSTTTTVGRLQGQGRVVAVRPVLAEESGHLCIGDVCAPLKSFEMPPLVKGFVSARRQVSLMSPTRITIIGAIVNMVLATMKIGTSPCQNTGPILPG